MQQPCGTACRRMQFARKKSLAAVSRLKFGWGIRSRVVAQTPTKARQAPLHVVFAATVFGPAVAWSRDGITGDDNVQGHQPVTIVPSSNGRPR